MAKELRPYRDELGEFKNDEESTVREESAPKSSVRKTALKILLASSEYHARFVRVTNDFENKLGAILTLLPIRLPTPHYYFPLTPRWCRRSGLIHQFEALVQVISLSNRDEPKKDCSLSPSRLLPPLQRRRIKCSPITVYGVPLLARAGGRVEDISHKPFSRHSVPGSLSRHRAPLLHSLR